MRAMSLTNEDGDGEQSDYRNLQAQLDTTNKLVKNLSKQLTELKEQVRFLSDATKLQPFLYWFLHMIYCKRFKCIHTMRKYTVYTCKKYVTIFFFLSL